MRHGSAALVNIVVGVVMILLHDENSHEARSSRPLPDSIESKCPPWSATAPAWRDAGARRGAAQEEEPAWVEGVAILGTVAVVVFVTAYLEYSKELQFQKLNAGGLGAQCLPTRIFSSRVCLPIPRLVRGGVACEPRAPRMIDRALQSPEVAMTKPLFSGWPRP